VLLPGRGTALVLQSPSSVMANSRSKLGQTLAKGLGIKLDYRDETGQSKLTRGESVFSVGTAESYNEEEPTAAEWLRSITPTGKDALRYLHNLFPFTHWIGRYNRVWLAGDMVAGKIFEMDTHGRRC